jgi:hypothetical protein
MTLAVRPVLIIRPAVLRNRTNEPRERFWEYKQQPINKVGTGVHSRIEGSQEAREIAQQNTIDL